MSRVLKNATNQIIQKYNTFTHRAVDIVKYQNKVTDVIAHSDGYVVELVTGKVYDRNSKGLASYGNYVKIKHDNGMYTLYAHLKSVYVKKNARVKRGDVIGPMGKSGNATGLHLHFEVRNSLDIRINPTEYLNNDLPDLKEKVNVIYQVYDGKKKKWLPNVLNDTDYAGNLSNPINAVYINLSDGNVRYRIHEKNNKWLPTVTNRDNYAGNIGTIIDGIHIHSDEVKLSYRVHLVDLGWLPWINEWNTTSDGYAGIYGYSIDALQIKVEED